MKRMHIAVLIVAVSMFFLLAAADRAESCSADSYLGTVCWTAFDFCPDGFMPADGRLLSVDGYNAVYHLIGTAYGGDGNETFALPDLRAATMVGIDKMRGSPAVALGQSGKVGTQNKSNLRYTTLTPCICVRGVFPSQPE